MYSNGGYFMLDFKNTVITNEPQRIQGLSYNVIRKVKKPIVICNLTISSSIISGSITNIYANKYVPISSTESIEFLLWITGSVEYYLVIQNDDTVRIVVNNLNTTQSLSLESEEITNASITDK